MSEQAPATLAQLRRARDLIDRDFAAPLDVAALASRAAMSSAHFSREFKRAYGETPYGYLVTRRMERAMALLRGGMSVTDACMLVGFSSLGSFSSMFSRLVGESPSAYRARPAGDLAVLPSCITRTIARPMPLPAATP